MLMTQQFPTITWILILLGYWLTLILVQVFSSNLILFPDIKVVLLEVFYKKQMFINPRLSKCFEAPDNQILIFVNNIALWDLIYKLRLICQGLPMHIICSWFSSLIIAAFSAS